jgi:hypothetical protein
VRLRGILSTSKDLDVLRKILISSLATCAAALGVAGIAHAHPAGGRGAGSSEGGL